MSVSAISHLSNLSDEDFAKRMSNCHAGRCKTLLSAEETLTKIMSKWTPERTERFEKSMTALFDLKLTHDEP